jgi:predicted RecB family nuclease
VAEKITREAVEAHLKCRLKAHLLMAGEHGHPHDYELMLKEAREHVRSAAVVKLLSRHGQGAPRGQPLTADLLRQGHALLLDAVLEDDDLSLRFDALVRVEGGSGLGDFHYLPVLFHEAERPKEEVRALLGIFGLLLGAVQGKEPAAGVLIHGRGCTGQKVKLSGVADRARRLLRELRETRVGPAPRLALNDHCQACEFRQRCHAEAVAKDDLSLLRGVSKPEAKAYARKGILTLTQLAQTFRPRRQGKRHAPRRQRHSPALQALAVRDRKVYVHGAPEVRDAPVRVYLDLEGDPDRGHVYLIGMIVANAGNEQRHSFWADAEGQEADVFGQFLAEVGKYDDYVVFCYGSYEQTFLKRMRKTAKRKKAVDRVLGRLVNVLSLVYAHVYFPAYSNGLKDVAACLGCSWSEPGASGLQSVVWRRRWEATRDEALKQKLLAYNLEDCAALKRVTEFLLAVAAPAPADGTGAGPPVARVEDVPRWDNGRTWTKIIFALPDFEHVNGCAYFDYQRERVYLRNSEAIRKSRRGKKNVRQRLRPTESVTVAARKCPRCGGTSFTTDVAWKELGCPIPRVKRAFDLRVTPAGIRRKVIECHSSAHRCLGCGHDFIPEAHDRLDKHFHGLKSWAVYQHVAHRVSIDAVRVMVEEFFGLRFQSSEVYMFKSLMARYYRPTCRALLRKLLSGPLLHVDETEVQLRTGKGYVWVFTSLEEVLYLYKPTREGDFLKEMLKDFKGVLVSDFYAAYDSLACPQQKCLIHLIRDMNQGLLDNPFDEELKTITSTFGALLRACVGTVDEHGLKRKHLARHAGDVRAFFDNLAGRSFVSEAAEALRSRLLKYRGKLFTFLDHDGVPWNNNNAEHAVKRFADYRELTVGVMAEGGLSDYLALLSVCETCRYKGVSFFRFLLSGLRDVDAFCRRKSARRRFPALQVYPKGFVPPHLAARERARAFRPRNGRRTAPGGATEEQP